MRIAPLATRLSYVWLLDQAREGHDGQGRRLRLGAVCPFNNQVLHLSIIPVREPLPEVTG